MKVIIKRFDKTLPLPEYKTKGAAAFDLYSRVEVIIPAGEVKLVPLNIAIAMPEGFYAQVSARSSLHKKGLLLANGVGIGDRDYCGNDDEYMAALYNFTKKDVKVSKGERVVQMIIMPLEKAELEEAEMLEGENRGGFGSTGM
jgi:dUTP pyrophosphatase